jgi:hypothetical protein
MAFEGGGVSTNINDESSEVFCTMPMNAIRVNPDARPAPIFFVETLMDNRVHHD